MGRKTEIKEKEWGKEKKGKNEGEKHKIEDERNNILGKKTF